MMCWQILFILECNQGERSKAVTLKMDMSWRKCFTLPHFVQDSHCEDTETLSDK